MTRFSSDSSRNGKDHRVNPTSSFGEHGGGGEINKKTQTSFLRWYIWLMDRNIGNDK